VIDSPTPVYFFSRIGSCLVIRTTDADRSSPVPDEYDLKVLLQQTNP
jgi:hypothetical protein